MSGRYMKNQYNLLKYENKEMADLILGRKGGKTTIKIIDQLLYRPHSINQLSKTLKLDYKTIQYHIELILNLELVEHNNKKYGTLYYPTKKLINNLKEYKQIKKYLNEL